MKKLIFMLSAICTLASCGDSQKKAPETNVEQTPAAIPVSAPTYTITYEGVGTINFNNTSEGLKLEGYEVRQEGETYIVADQNGKTVMTKQDETIEVVSPLFKTEEGACVGMTLSEVAKLIGKWSAHTTGDGNLFAFIRTGFDNNICFAVNPDQLKDASMLSKFRAKPEKLTVDDFKPDTKIEKIIIYQLI